MYSLVNSNFNRTYNPTHKQNALCDIKRLLTSRDTDAQAKACGYLIEVISKYDINSQERPRLVEYLLENDITVFLCEATSNLDFNLFGSVLQCIRLIWTSRPSQFFSEEHAPHAMAAVLRALAHFIATNSNALDVCLHFLCDLLKGITKYSTTSPLSYQSAYNTEQLLASFKMLATRNISANSKNILSSALVLQELISYQPDDLIVRSCIAKELVEIIKKWLELLLAGLNHQGLLVGCDIGVFLIVICQIAVNTSRLIKNFEQAKGPTDFVNKILTDKNEIDTLKQIALDLRTVIHQSITELVVFVKDNLHSIATEEYATFLKFVLNFYYEADAEALSDFSDILLCKGYLAALPTAQIERNDITVRKLSILILGELLKVLTEKYLFIKIVDANEPSAKDVIQMGLIELQNGIEKPQSIGVQLQKKQPYCLLIYVYFCCQSSENPEESTAPLFPYLVEHILRQPKSYKPPSYIIKALWLVFAMSSMSNRPSDLLNERVYIEKATGHLVSMLQPDPAIYYTHNPAILFWAFTSLRIPNYMRLAVLSQWLKAETTLPEELIKEKSVRELLLDVLTQIKDREIISNCMKALNSCLKEGDDSFKEEFGELIWCMLPEVLSNTLINCENEIDTSVCYFLDLATNLLPSEADQELCLKIAVLLTTLYSKNITDHCSHLETKFHYDYVCLKLCLLLLQFADDQKDSKVLLSYTNKPSFLTNVLSSINSSDESVACTALELLSYIVHCFHTNNYQAKYHLQLKTDMLVRSLQQNSFSDRGGSLLQLVYTVLRAGVNTPLVLTYSVEETPSRHQQFDALRALMFRVQISLCHKDSDHRLSTGWKTLSSIFKHAIVYMNDTKLVALLTCQPWMYTLVRFQLVQDVNIEFITFLKNWLVLLKIAIKKSRQDRKILISKYSLIARTMSLVNKFLAGDKHKETKDIILNTVKEILEECSSRK